MFICACFIDDLSVSVKRDDCMAGPIDFTKRFIPERLTPLYHTSVYSRLSAAQQLRYNQLHASYFNEQTIFFESAMAQHILRGFAKQNLPTNLSTGLQTFMTEEAQHSQMFRELNLKCLPQHYGGADFYFVRLSGLAAVGLRQWVGHPGFFPFLLWVLLIQEERALFCAKEFLSHPDALEPNFLAAQRRHLADEVGHIQWDEELLDCIWPKVAGWRRHINARLFAWMMGEYFTTPKRSGLRVVAELVKEFSELKALWPELRGEMLGLATHREFNLLSYSRSVTPRAFARFDQCPEFSSLGRVLVGYEPNRAGSSASLTQP
jgi:hypothetical protein